MNDEMNKSLEDAGSEMQATTGQPPLLTTKSGITTSQGQFTAVFILASIILSYFGINLPAEQLETWAGMVNTIALVIVPILGSVVVLVNYTNSRGKIASNALWSNASIQSPTSLAGDIGISKAVFGGKNWKDINRYMNILDMVGKTGVVPGLGPVTNAIQGNPDPEMATAQLQQPRLSDDDIKRIVDEIAKRKD